MGEADGEAEGVTEALALKEAVLVTVSVREPVFDVEAATLTVAVREREALLL